MASRVRRTLIAFSPWKLPFHHFDRLPNPSHAREPGTQESQDGPPWPLPVIHHDPSREEIPLKTLRHTRPSSIMETPAKPFQ